MNRLTAIFCAILFSLSGCLPANLPQQPTGTPAPPSPVAPEQVVTVKPVPSPALPVAEARAGGAEPQWIALVGLDGNLWLVDALSGEKKAITQDGTPQAGTSTPKRRTYYCCSSWSSDGKLLAFRSILQVDTDGQTQWSFSIGVYDVERAEAKVMRQDVQVSSLAFRPGTHLLAYDEVLDPGYFVNGQPDAGQAHGISGLDADTGETRELVRPEHGLWLFEPHWSPDGNLLGFTEQTRFEDPIPFALYDFRNKVYSAWNQVIGSYAFAPDSRRIAYDRLSNGGFAGNERIWVSDVWGKDEQAFSPDATPMAFGPAWSRRGDLLAYKLGEPANSPGHVGNLLVVQPAVGGEARRLGSFGYMGPLAWSPDGTRVAFSSGPYDRQLITVVSVADGSVEYLGNGYDPAWQPGRNAQ